MYANALFHLIFPLACLLSTATCAVSWTASSTGRCLQSSRALGGFRSNNGGVHGKDFSGCGRSSCADQRFLGRRGDLVPWSWIIVRVFKAKSGGYPKVNGPAEFLPGTLRSTHSQESKITAREAMILVHELTAHTVGGVIGRSETIMQIIPRRRAGDRGQGCSRRHRSGGIESSGGRAHHGGQRVSSGHEHNGLEPMLVAPWHLGFTFGSNVGSGGFA
jgi:hypothetical protein